MFHLGGKKKQTKIGFNPGRREFLRVFCVFSEGVRIIINRLSVHVYRVFSYAWLLPKLQAQDKTNGVSYDETNLIQRLCEYVWCLRANSTSYLFRLRSYDIVTEFRQKSPNQLLSSNYTMVFGVYNSPVFLRTWSRCDSNGMIRTFWKTYVDENTSDPWFLAGQMWGCCQVWCTWQGRQGCKIRCTPKTRAKICGVHNSLMFLFQGKMVSFKMLVFNGFLSERSILLARIWASCKACFDFMLWW